MLERFYFICGAIVLMGLIIVAVSGCAAVGYVAGAGSAVHSEMKFQRLEDRIVALENGDIW